jgi:hypothetical protein
MNTITAAILAVWYDRGGSHAVAYSPMAIAQTQPAPTPATGTDALLTMPLLADKLWFIHAYGGRVRACTADGASVAGERPAPKCSQWSEY